LGAAYDVPVMMFIHCLLTYYSFIITVSLSFVRSTHFIPVIFQHFLKFWHQHKRYSN